MPLDDLEAERISHIMIFIDLAMNLSLLVALSIVSGFVNSSMSERWRGRSIVQGLIFGFVSMAGMLKPFVLMPGIFFDGRSVVLSICAFFFGPLSALIAFGMAALCRFHLGGSGTLTGILVLASSSGIGLFFNYLRNRKSISATFLNLLCLGYSVHIAMILIMFTLPFPVAIKTVKNISLPVLLFFPFATVLIGRILDDQESRKEFIKVLAESERKYRHIIETANEGILILDNRQSIIYANSRAESMLQYSMSEMIGKKFMDFIYEPEMTAENTACEIPADFIHPHERKFLCKNGDILWAMVSNSAITDDPGNPGGLFAMITDITAIKTAEQTIEKERNLFIGGPSIVFTWRNQPYWPVEYVSKNVINHLGYTPEDFTSGKHKFADFVHPDDWSGVDSDALSMVSTPDIENYTQTYRMRAADGHYIWFNDFTVVVRNHRNEITHLHGYLTNISDRIAAEEALRESEARLRNILEKSPIGIALSRDGITLESNPAYLRMFGYNSIDEICNTPILNQIAESQRERVREIIKNRAEGLTVESTYETIGLKKDGTEFPFLVSSNRMLLNDGPVTIAFFTDLTEQKKIENERLEIERRLFNAQKLESLGILAGGIAHDFNNLLMAILGHADLALYEISPVSPVRQQLEEIVTASKRASDLCRQMLAYSGKGLFITEKIVLKDFIYDMIHLLKTCVSKNVIINIDIEDSLPLIEADPGQLRQLVMNLVINASEAIGEENGTITISGYSEFCRRSCFDYEIGHEELSEGLYVILEVKDTGCGMTREVREKIFEPFFTTKFTGRGLGMSAVLGITRGHRGTVKIISEPGNGSLFRIFLPAVGMTGKSADIADHGKN